MQAGKQMSDPLVSILEKKLQNYLVDLEALVRIDSGTAHKAGVDQVVDWMENRLNNLGFEIERLPQTKTGDNLLAALDGNGSGTILLLGHSDTVYPVGTTAERPLKIEGDKILGPGTCDMKAGLLSGCYAVEALSELGFLNFGRIVLLCVSDEEVQERYSYDLIRAAARQADAVFTLEAARENGDIVIARKGVRVYAVETFGHAAHAGVEPEKGRNAILALAHLCLKLAELNGFRPDVTLNPGVIEGGTQSNVVPDYARLLLDVRAFTTDDLDAVAAAAREIVESETQAGIKASITQAGQGHDPMPYTREAAALEAMAKEAAGELGFSLQGAFTGGASDASLAAAQGVPVLDGLGPVGGLDHSPDEYILLNSIVPRTALLAKLIILATNRIKEQR